MSSNAELHALFTSRSLAKARQVLARVGGAGGKGAGLSKSPNNYGGGGGMANAAIAIEVNRRDAMGRTLLHRVVSEVDVWADEWLDWLLGVSGVGVNLVDQESGWTALHRALYVGNLAAARKLLSRDDVDAGTKDREGLTAFDVYNSTVEGTNPPPLSSLVPASSSSAHGRLELFTWGANRNYVLGFPGDGDRAHPERVPLKRLENDGGRGVGAFRPLGVTGMGMARLHTAIVTDESHSNVRVCGYGTGGRLGSISHTQFTFTPLLDFPHRASLVFLSPDHTVLVTSAGLVYTYGLNRFSQLGYPLDTPAHSKGVSDEPIQATPKRVVGVLKKEVIIGAACSRIHTVAFTLDSLYTWGTNKGQLGYSTPGTSVQVLPRKVTMVQGALIMVTATESATACLMETKEVLVLHKEGFIKIVFPMARFPREMQTYRPPQISGKPNIDKITSCGTTFAALSSLGDVFTFTLDSSPLPNSAIPSTSSSDSTLARTSPKPQRIWSLRRKFTAVTDVAVGLDGSVIVCTVSGHVFVRTRKFEAKATTGTMTPPPGAVRAGSSAGGGWKFSRVPYLQRCVSVSANSTGGFGAIRSDVPLRFVDLEGPSLEEDFVSILPHWRRLGAARPKLLKRRPRVEEDEDEGETEYARGIEREVAVALGILHVLREWDATWERVGMAGSDAVVQAGGKNIPVHRLVMAARSSTLGQLFDSGRTPALSLDCSDFTALLFLHYLYSDELPPVWDARVGLRLRERSAAAILDIGGVKAELQALAHRFHLDALAKSLQSHHKTAPLPTLPFDIGRLYDSASPAADIVLQLADRDILCHSVVLRARCPFFETFYEDLEWSSRRSTQPEVLKFDLKHLTWDSMEPVLHFLYCDAGIEIFDSIDRSTADEYIDFVTLVMAAANELLLDKMKLICSDVLRGFVTLHNVCAILVDAAFYEADDLSRACMQFLTSSMETVLEGRLLDDLPPNLLAAVSVFCQERQSARLPISRSGILVGDLMIKHAGWLSELDVGRVTGGAKRWRPSIASRSPGPSPNLLLSPGPSPPLRPRGPSGIPQRDSPRTSPAMQPLRETNEPFAMDEDFSLDAPSRTSSIPGWTPTPIRSSTPSTPLSFSPSTPSYLPLGSPPPSRLQPWTKTPISSSKNPLDLRSIMAVEAATDRRQQRTPSATPPPGSPLLVGSSAFRPSTPSWRPNEPTRAISLANIQFEQADQPRPRAAPPSSLPRAADLGTRPVASPLPFPRADLASGTGAPVYSPSQLSTRRTPSSSGTRTPSARSGSAFVGADVPWTNYTTAPSSPPAPTFSDFSPSPPSAFSFASIQSEQKAQVDAIREIKAPRSFSEVMRREKEDATAKAEEAAFAVWWEAETARMSAEANGTVVVGTRPIAADASGGRGGKGGRGKGAKKRGGGQSARAAAGGGDGRLSTNYG